jgi:6-phosphogluconolactonase (cycloisomerase 2 family)
MEYTPWGLPVREINLQLDGDLLRSWHAIGISAERFVVCISRGRGSSSDDVVEVNSDGRVVLRYKDQLQSTKQRQFDWPRHLAFDKKNERIYVADYFNDRIVMLSRLSESACKLEMSVDGRSMHRPRCLHFEESSIRIGEWAHRVFINK